MDDSVKFLKRWKPPIVWETSIAATAHMVRYVKELVQYGHLMSGKLGMAPHTRNLSDQDMRHLAAYYAYLPRTTPPANLVEQLKTPRICKSAGR
jgi:cytochrome c553